MALPTSKQELADWILRRLGAPVVNIELTDEQLEDMIDEAVQFFQEYHYDGAERAYRTIKIEGDVLTGNNRRHQDVNAPMYDSTIDDTYRVGDRVMTYKIDGTPDRIWIKYDSEESVTFVTYSFSLDGDYFVFDSDLLIADYRFLKDGNAEDHVDSEGVFVSYDSDAHNKFVYSITTDSERNYIYSLGTGIPVAGSSFVDSEGTYVAYDSDTHVVYQYDSDVAGGFVDSESVFVSYDSDKHQITGAYRPYDSDNDAGLSLFVLIDGTYVAYDSETHNTFDYVQDATGTYVREEGVYRYVPDATDPVYQLPGVIKFKRITNTQPLFVVASSTPVQRFKRQFTYPTFYTRLLENTWTDSDGTFVQYDSDKHQTYSYDSDVNGVWTRTDSDSETNGYVVYDSDKHTYLSYQAFGSIGLDLDSELLAQRDLFVDSDGTFVAYDSDKHNYFIYESDAAGIWVDSDNDGNFGIYRATTYSYTAFDSDGQILDSDGNVVRSSFDSEGALYELYLDSDGTFVQYDSDKHAGIFYDSEYVSKNDSEFDSDGAQNFNNFVRNLDKLFYRHIDFRFVQKYSRRSVRQPVFVYNPGTLPQRYNRTNTTIKYRRDSVLLGLRLTQTVNRNEVRRAYGFADLWKEEKLVMIEPQVDYDYSKVGQVGVPIPENIIGINKVFRIDNFSGMGMWNYEYQYFLNNFDFFYGSGGAGGMPMTNYYITKSHIDFIDNLMNVQPAIRFSKHRNRLYIDSNWTRFEKSAQSRDYYLMIECYEVNDPEVFGDVYKDKWLKRYATALTKQQWGSNLKKHNNLVLPGGVQIDGQAIYDEGKEEAEKLEQELRDNNQLEMDFIIG